MNYTVVQFLFSLTRQPLQWKTWEVWSVEPSECN